MKLSFPNPSRNFDSAKDRVQFWAYDQSIEISFYVDTATLRQLHPSMTEGQEGALSAFDAHTDRIRKVASKVYQRRPFDGYSYNLPGSDF